VMTWRGFCCQQLLPLCLSCSAAGPLAFQLHLARNSKSSRTMPVHRGKSPATLSRQQCV
jgi:hypothetical protein